jgi:hypothetical protein
LATLSHQISEIIIVTEDLDMEEVAVVEVAAVVVAVEDESLLRSAR